MKIQMKKNSALSRRSLLKATFGAAGFIAASGTLTRAFAAACQLTPKQTEGPFYPIEKGLDQNSDLTYVDGRSARAKGQVVYIQGKAMDAACLPVAGALVEIWQACSSGKYSHPGDTNPAPLDPDFQYYGKCLTDDKGAYLFKTILPGAYPADVDWIRPPHIHFKVHKLGYHELTTQMYFEGNEHNDRDKILQAIPASERGLVVIPMKEPSPEMEPGSKLCEFDISILKV